jgi:hypothetical protein
LSGLLLLQGLAVLLRSVLQLRLSTPLPLLQAGHPPSSLLLTASFWPPLPLGLSLLLGSLPPSLALHFLYFIMLSRSLLPLLFASASSWPLCLHLFLYTWFIRLERARCDVTLRRSLQRNALHHLSSLPLLLPPPLALSALPFRGRAVADIWMRASVACVCGVWFVALTVGDV